MLSASVHAPTISSVSLSLSCKHSLSLSSMAASSVRIAVVGDVHDCWNLEEDSKALELLQPDLVLFTGDFGDENVEVVQSVAKLEFPKAVILGNHDSWFTNHFSGSEKDNVQLQLECLGKEHVAYQRLDFPTIKVSVVGGRPFSHGGKPLFRRQLLSARENNQVSIPLVVFGHMHKELAYGNGFRKMIVVGPDNAIYLNGAIVPRVKTLLDEVKRNSEDEGATNSLKPNGTTRAFTLVEISEGKVEKIAENWVSVVKDRTQRRSPY